jgi:prepilin-type N-terminal cleavage/methylation domain-containing protein
MQPANNRQLKTQRAFTLIELLVVIAIIGILAGMVVVNMSGATESARVAKLKVFSSSIRSSLMANRVSEWKFEEGTGTTTADTVGSNGGTLTGSPTWKTTAECASNNCLSFDAVDDYVSCGSDSSLDVSEAVTIEAWVKVSAFGTNQYRGIAGRRSGAIVDGCNIQYGLSSNWSSGNYFEFWAHKEGSTDCNGSSYILSSAVDLNKWYHLVGTYDSATGLQTIYLNGAKNSQANKGAGVKIRSFASQPFEIGRNPGNSSWRFNGFIDEVRVYNQALTLSAIRENYLAGLEELHITSQIADEEYRQRMVDLNSTYATSE